MDAFLQTYLDRNNIKDEFEIRFGENCTKMNYNNVIQWLLMAGFHIVHPNGLDLLRISIETVKSRVELTGFDSVQTLCKDNTLTRPKYTTKTNVGTFDGKKKDFGIRMSLSNEDPASIEVVDEITKTWLTSPKTFRYMNRIQLKKDGIPFVVDCSIIRMVRAQKNASMLFSSNLTYEIEAEFINSERALFKKENIQQIITYVLRGFQRTYFPTSLTILDDVKEEYIQMTNTKSVPQNKRFIGPNLVTLQLDSVYTNEDPNHVSIQQDFTVTDKADGERKMLMINKTGQIFLITSGLIIENTGCKTDILKSVLIDGEHIEYNKEGRYINTYMCFDLYLYQDKKKMVDARPMPFVDGRLSKLKEIISAMNQTMEFNSPIALKIDVKIFYYKADVHDTRSIFDLCKLILNKQDTFMYKTDGLIFTPSNYGVGLSKTVHDVKNYRDTWNLNFKWKPVEDNTIDFYVRLKEYVPGMKYRTMWLYVGFSLDDIHASPCFSIFNANELGIHSRDKIIFQTMEPYDEHSHICNMDTESGILHTEFGEVIEDEMIIEYKYDKNAMPGWNWIPLRIRWDKMKQSVDSQGKSIMIRSPNSYTTAASNWYTIHNPITHTMITTGFYDVKQTNPIKDTTYYNETKTDYMNPLRDFHNKIKKRLIDIHIRGQSIPLNRTLIDFAVGKAGDLQKWKESKFGFVLGIDITHDNINNKKNGACKRYLSSFTHGYKTRCLFLNGDSSKNIHNGSAFHTIPEKLINESIFGSRRITSLGKGVSDQYGKGAPGFDIASIQFAVHYMFKSKETLSGFLKNVAECTKMHGYFIGTCFDGDRVLKKMGSSNEYVSIENGNMICSIKKSSSEMRQTLTMDDCLGFTVEVNQSTIGKPIDEYLVYFPFFVQEMKRYGFEVEDNMEGFTTGIGPFNSLYVDDFKMNTGQKDISFLNNYFIFKKQREIKMFVEKLGHITI